MKISAVYKITNTVTGDFYIGSSKNVKHRWESHKCQSTWKNCPNNLMYLDMQKYGVDKFEFQVIAEVEVDKLKETEQRFIETLKPIYNDRKAKGLDIERRKESCRKSSRKYEKTDKRKKYQKEYYQKCKKAKKEYYSQLCFYNGETITLCALRNRFRKMGISNPTSEAKKYLLQ